MDDCHKRGFVDTPGRSRGFVSAIPPIALGLLGVVLLYLCLSFEDAVSAFWDASSVDRAVHRQAAQGPHQIEFAKTVQPLDPDTGGTITVCVSVSGHSQQVDLVLAQDVSTSMRQPSGDGRTRLEACQSAAGTIIDSLPSADRIAVVAYDKVATLEHGLTTDRAAISDTVAGLVITTKGTNIGEAIAISHDELSSGPDALPTTLKTIILLSDGYANCDENRVCTSTGDPVIMARAKAYARAQAVLAAEDSIRIFAIGFGSSVDAELLQEIATLGHGKYYGAPDEETLRSIYRAIVDELRSLSVTDVLAPGLETDCAKLPDASCTVGASGATTVTWDVPNPAQAPDPAEFCLTATVTLDPGFQGPSNLPGSEVCYTQSDGQPVCDPLDAPMLHVGGRKISGRVFYDLDGNGVQGPGEGGVPGMIVRANTEPVARTDAGGAYLLRTSSTPALALTIDLPAGSEPTTPYPQQVPAQTGIYERDFGILGTVYVQYLPLALADYPVPTIVNGGFEEGWLGWEHGGRLRQAVVRSNPYAGAYSALLGDPGYVCQGGVPDGSAWVEQTWLVPHQEDRTLTFRYNIISQDLNPGYSDPYDSFDVRINKVLVYRDARTAGEYGCAPQMQEDLGWREGEIDLKPFRGQRLTVRFEVRNTADHWYNTWVYVDEVRLGE